MTLKLITLVFVVWITFTVLVSLSYVNSFNVPDEDFETIALPSVKIQLEPILTTPTSKFVLSSIATDVRLAQQHCHQHGGSLLFVESSEELENIKTAIINLQENEEDIFWTSGIRYSNATVENLLVWSITQKPFSFLLTASDNFRLARATFSKNRYAVRNRRSVDRIEVESDNKKNCPCTCPPIIPIPTPAPCKRSICEGSRPPCVEKEPRKCLIARPPICEAQKKNCTTECGTPIDCRVIREPVCEIIPSSRKLCRLEIPNLGKCRIVRAPNCRIISPGYCHSLRVECKQKVMPPCEPIVKPCKNPCSQQECSTVQPPCVTEQPPCVTTTTPCPPQTPPPDCLKRCKRSTASKASRRKCEQGCITPPIECGQPTTVCPTTVTVCPPPVSTCTRPFVDCSPEICQSNVVICPPPKLQCPPSQVICESPKIECGDPEVECPEAEVICDTPDIKCSKPLIKCPDPVVNCDPIISTCETVPTICSDPNLDCPDPKTSCGKPRICHSPSQPDNGGGCQCNVDCGGTKGKRNAPPPDLEFVEKLECIALNSAKVDSESEWLPQSCNLKHRFICRMYVVIL